MRQFESVPALIRDGEADEVEDLHGVFQRASLSNENDRRLRREHPEWLVLSDLGDREGRTGVAVDEDGTVTGFVTHLISGDVAELEEVFVDPPRMRQGIAAALVPDVSERLRVLGFERMEVTANPHAMPFYLYLGLVAHEIVDTPGYPAPRKSRPTSSPASASSATGDRRHVDTAQRSCCSDLRPTRPA